MNPNANRMKTIGIALAIAVLVMLGAVGLSRRSSSRAARTGQNATELQPIVVEASDIPAEPEGVEMPLPAATDNGPAIAVWEPVCASADARTAALGAGASRWLCVAVGGLGQFGRQPAYPSFQRVADELHRSDLRLSGAEGLRAAHMAGVTHSITGEITGDAGRLTLTYTITEVASGKALGAPISVSGSSKEVAKALPGLGRAIAERLGVKVATIPGGPTPAAADLTAFGAESWQVLRRIPIARLRALERLAPRLPVAGVCALDAVRWQDPSRLVAALKAMVAAAPDNIVVQAEAARQISANAPDRRERVSSLLRRFPNNYLLVRTDVRLQPGMTDDLVVAAARTGTTLSPTNADAWYAYSAALQAAAEGLRGGRVAADITSSEWKVLRQRYAECQAAATRAVRLDPQYGNAWLNVSSSAQTSSQNALADKAFWLAARLCRPNPQLYFWGLNMYQPKWQGDAEKLARVESLAGAASFDAPADAQKVARYLRDGSRRDLAQAQFERAITLWKALAAERPDESWPRLGLADAYDEMGRATAAMNECRGVIARFPSDIDARCRLGYLYLKGGDYKSAAASYQQAEAHGSMDSVAHGKLGIALIRLKRWKQGEAELRGAVRDDPNWAEGHAGLGEAAQAQGRQDDAIREYETAVRLNPADGDSWDRLARLLNQARRYPEAVSAAESGLPYNRGYVYAYSALGEAYLGAKRYQESADAFEAYLKQMNGDAGAHMLRARALFRLNQRAEAVEECNACIRLAPKSPAAAIARRLIQQNAGKAGASA